MSDFSTETPFALSRDMAGNPLNAPQTGTESIQGAAKEGETAYNWPQVPKWVIWEAVHAAVIVQSRADCPNR